MPRDDNNDPIPALRLKDDGAHTIAVTASSARNSTAFDADTKIISLYATGPVYIRLGDSSVTASATDHYFPAGIYYDIAVNGGRAGQSARDTHIAVLRADTDCQLFVSEKQ